MINNTIQYFSTVAGMYNGANAAIAIVKIENHADIYWAVDVLKLISLAANLNYF